MCIFLRSNKSEMFGKLVTELYSQGHKKIFFFALFSHITRSLEKSCCRIWQGCTVILGLPWYFCGAYNVAAMAPTIHCSNQRAWGKDKTSYFSFKFSFLQKRKAFSKLPWMFFNLHTYGKTGLHEPLKWGW